VAETRYRDSSGLSVRNRWPGGWGGDGESPPHAHPFLYRLGTHGTVWGFELKVVLVSSGAFDQGVWGVYASFYGGSNDTIGDLDRQWQPVIPLFSHGGSPIVPHLPHHIRLYTLTFTFGGKGVIRSCRHLTAAALSSRSDIIRIVFSLLMSPSE
jgi:hypothetical protein